MKIKRIIITILICLTSVIYLFLVWIGFQKQNIQLENCNYYESYVISSGLDYRNSSKGRKSNVFYVLLHGMDKKLGVYRMSKDYNDLLSAIKHGDKLKVYYSDNNKKENVNIDLIQVEKNGQILLDKKEYEKKESTLIYMGLFGTLVTYVIAYHYYRYGNNKR